MNGSNNISWVW